MISISIINVFAEAKLSASLGLFAEQKSPPIENA